jgi:amino acid permease
VTAVAGDAVYLPCDITTDSGDAVLLVLWYREDLGTPIYRSVTETVCSMLAFIYSVRDEEKIYHTLLHLSISTGP